MKEEQLECQAREAVRIAESAGIYVEEQDYLNGELWVYDKMKSEMKEKCFNCLLIGFFFGGVFMLFFKDIFGL